MPWLNIIVADLSLLSSSIPVVLFTNHFTASHSVTCSAQLRLVSGRWVRGLLYLHSGSRIRIDHHHELIVAPGDHEDFLPQTLWTNPPSNTWSQHGAPWMFGINFIPQAGWFQTHGIHQYEYHLRCAQGILLLANGFNLRRGPVDCFWTRMIPHCDDWRKMN